MKNYNDKTEFNDFRKQDGFRDEQYFIIPAESFKTYVRHPMIQPLYLTDVGYFPRALNH